MVNWEGRFNRVQMPDSSVPSHRDELRKKLQSNHIPGGHGGRTIATLGVAMLVAFGALTAAYPGWAKGLWNSVLVQTITFRTDDGHVVLVKKIPAENCCPASDTACQMVMVEAGERRMISFEATADRFSMTGDSAQTITISTPDCDKIWIVNGDTVSSKDIVFGTEEWSDTDADVEDAAKHALQATAEGPEVNASFELQQNYPNPFNPTTQIAFDLKQGGPVTLKVYNLMGQEVATLLNGQTEAGHHTISFDGSNLPSGTYIYTLQAADLKISRMMILAK